MWDPWNPHAGVKILLKCPRVGRQTPFPLTTLYQASAYKAGRLLTDSEIPTSVESISPKKDLENVEKQASHFANDETGACRALAQVHIVIKVGKNLDLQMVSPDLCASHLGTLPFTRLPGVPFSFH